MKDEKRGYLISKLVDDDIGTVKDSIILDDVWYLSEILRGGFKGYANYSDEELKKECNNRGFERI